MADRDKNPLATWIPIMISSVATVISIVTFIVTVNPWAPVGVVSPVAGVMIVRGIDSPEGIGLGPYPSDHLVFHLEWRNDTGNSLLIRQPMLVLHKLGEDTGDERRELNFYMVNELPGTSPATMEKIITNSQGYPSNSIYLQPHSIVSSTVLFRVEDWATNLRCFRFHSGESYRIEIEYHRAPDTPIWHGNPRISTLTKQMTMPETVNWLAPYGKGNPGWDYDYISLLPGTRATSNAPVSEDAHKYFTELQECR